MTPTPVGARIAGPRVAPDQRSASGPRIPAGSANDEIWIYCIGACIGGALVLASLVAGDAWGVGPTLGSIVALSCCAGLVRWLAERRTNRLRDPGSADP